MFEIQVGKDTFFLVYKECVLCFENNKLMKRWSGRTKFVPEEEVTRTNAIEKKESLPVLLCASQYCTDE